MERVRPLGLLSLGCLSACINFTSAEDRFCEQRPEVCSPAPFDAGVLRDAAVAIDSALAEDASTAADADALDAITPDAMNDAGAGVPDLGALVSVTITGLGTVTSTPAGIACPPTCEAPFADGTLLSLSTVVDPGFYFAGWSGPPECRGGSCSFEVDGGAALEVALDAELQIYAPMDEFLEISQRGCFFNTAGVVALEDAVIRRGMSVGQNSMAGMVVIDCPNQRTSPTAMTLCAFINAGSGPGLNRASIFSSGTDTTAAFMVSYIRATERLEWEMWRENGGGLSDTIGGPLAPDLFHHVCFVFDAQTPRAEIFVNGETPVGFTTLAPSSALRETTYPLFIGDCLSCAADRVHFRGIIDEVKVWGRALAPDEISTQCHQAGGFCP